MKMSVSLKESEGMIQSEVLQNLERYLCVHVLWYWGRVMGKEKVLRFYRPY